VKKSKDKPIKIPCEYCHNLEQRTEMHMYDGYLFCPGCWHEYCVRHKIDKKATSSKEGK
jgi:hypothetical protein